ncbi:VOC family protein [Bailinhaonella thermotolerans]|uniref:Extradiol dioxygenase n=1 Tax=Bailinhaonella thermotolerans TaxID=1070861 RepID=A0A3A4AUF3_9ACTN|nr:VOC family protein [Bailinhaonella thermotolerans]RJL25068.1 extradiol dioxygenase [Bailinhaonella thermotolerans]
MITGAHVVMFSRNPDADRAFFRDVLRFPSVKAGDGWPIFALPPAEVGIHPTGEGGSHELYLMCDDIDATVKELAGRGVEFSRPVSDEGWGLVAWIRTPAGSELALYEPKHPTAAARRS